MGGPLPNTEVKIVDPMTGQTVNVGEQGELCTRGYLVMKGYDGDPKATSQVIDSEGWLHTGDLAFMRPDGYFRITGRAKDMISRGGEKIYPREIEEFLHGHPKVADVYVVGLPDERLGESVLAWIKLKNGQTATPDEIRRFLPQPDRLLQDSPAHSVRGLFPHDGERQGAEVPHPPAGDPGPRPGRRGGDCHCVTVFTWQSRSALPAGAPHLPILPVS